MAPRHNQKARAEADADAEIHDAEIPSADSPSEEPGLSSWLNMFLSGKADDGGAE